MKLRREKFIEWLFEPMRTGSASKTIFGSPLTIGFLCGWTSGVGAV